MLHVEIYRCVQPLLLDGVVLPAQEMTSQGQDDSLPVDSEGSSHCAIAYRHNHPSILSGRFTALNSAVLCRVSQAWGVLRGGLAFRNAALRLTGHLRMTTQRTGLRAHGESQHAIASIPNILRRYGKYLGEMRVEVKQSSGPIVTACPSADPRPHIASLNAVVSESLSVAPSPFPLPRARCILHHHWTVARAPIASMHFGVGLKWPQVW